MSLDLKSFLEDRRTQIEKFLKNYFDQYYYEYRLKRMYFVHYMNFNSFEQINEFIEKNSLSRKRKWWEKYEWNSLVTTKSKEKFAICSKTFQMMKIE
jgi:hypothetical protein